LKEYFPFSSKRGLQPHHGSIFVDLTYNIYNRVNLPPVLEKSSAALTEKASMLRAQPRAVKHMTKVGSAVQEPSRNFTINTPLRN
jgi:hypothetical protein